MLSVEAYDNSKVIIDPQQESRHWENNYNNFNNASQHRQLRIDGCYNKWSKFRDDVAKSKGYETFVICPGTTFQPHTYYEKHSDIRQSQLTINAAAVKLLCGDDGSFSNDCTITGGLSHIEVSNDAGAWPGPPATPPHQLIAGGFGLEQPGLRPPVFSLVQSWNRH